MENNSEVSAMLAQLELVFSELAEIRIVWQVKAEELDTMTAAHTAKLQEAKVLLDQLKRQRTQRVAELLRNVDDVDEKLEFIIKYKNHHRYALPLPRRWKSFASGFSAPVRVQRGPGGPSWSVELLGADLCDCRGLFMCSGWEKFVADNDVEHDDTLSVRYVGQGVFHITVVTYVDDGDAGF